jgi:acyl-CoA hydrolase/GNAT superfamily N-acetyltransferase
MNFGNKPMDLEEIRRRYPEKFALEEEIFGHIHGGDRIFVGAGCGEPQYLVNALARYAESFPKAFVDAEVYHIWTLGVLPYADEKLKHNFRHDSFFIGNTTRDAVNRGAADYTPVFLSQVPKLFRRKIVPIDVALVQTSPPDDRGYLSLGINVDITKDAVKNASLVIAQVNSRMPRVYGDSLVHVNDVDFIVPHDEPLLEYAPKVSDDIARRIGKYVSRIIEDGDTLQVGYGSAPNAILEHLRNKRHLGIHTELLTDGVVDLMKAGVIDNSRKSIDRGKTVTSFCMGKREVYDYIHNNRAIEFRTIDYTNNPLVIARQRNMVAINGALQIDLTGQATAESIGRIFYSGIGGSADFMRGAAFAPGGKTILALESTARGGEVSRIVPFLDSGTGVTLGRGDVQYVITEYGSAYLHGKNIRERAMDLISIAHPSFRPWLIEEARGLNLIYRDQAFIPGERGHYPETLETWRTTKSGLRIFLRPVKISDEPLLKEMFYALSESTIRRRFFRMTNMPHDFLQRFVVIDYTEKMAILALLHEEGRDKVIGVGRYTRNEDGSTAQVMLTVRDDYQNRGIGGELLSYLTYLARRQGLFAFTAEVLLENEPMLCLLRHFEETHFDIEKGLKAGVFEMRLAFKG